ncbi:MAG: DUF4350 domain-containing protein [Bacteroidota bacterium]
MTDKRPLIIFGVAALIVLIFFVFIRSGGNRYSWVEDYEEVNKDPYGTYVIRQLLDDYFPNQQVVEIAKNLAEELIIDSSQINNYVFIGEGLYLDSTRLNTLIDFVQQGNNAFIASKSIPYELMDIVYEDCNELYWYDYDYLQDTSVYLSFTHPNFLDPLDFQYKFIRYNKVKNYTWNYIDSSFFCEDQRSMVRLGLINDNLANFVKKDYGEGAFYFHTTPIAFSNIQLLDSLGLDYVGKVFSHLETGPTYWDKASRIPLGVAKRRNNYSGGGSEKGAGESPLQYILRQPSLAWAWYLSLLLGLLYLLFRAKRKQRIIPIIAPNTNSSMEFISTIGTLYFLQNDHKKLCLQKMKLFLAYLRERYYVSTKDLDEPFVDKVVAKSEIPKEVVKKILLYYQNIQSSPFVSEKTLIEFHLEMDKFYKNCK